MSYRELHRQPKGSPTLALDLVIGVVLFILTLPLIAAMRTLPLAQGLVWWTIPLIAIIGLAGGILLALLPLSPSLWWAPLVAGATIGGGLELGQVIGATGEHNPWAVTGASAVGAYLMALMIMLPWLVFRVRQPWLALSFIWISVAGAWGSNLSIAQIWQLIWMLALALTLVGLCHLRDNVALWQRLKLERLGPVTWPTARVVVLVSLVIALIGLTPLGVSRITALNKLWNKTPLGITSPLTYESNNGVPVAILGAPLAVTGADISNNKPILNYTILKGQLGQIPPLFGTSLDTYNQGTWEQGSSYAGSSLVPASSNQSNADTIVAQITLLSVDGTYNSIPILPGFTNPSNFSIAARPQLIGQLDSSALAVADWQATHSLQAYTMYRVTSVPVPISGDGSGKLDPQLVQRLTAVPAAVQQQLDTLAHAWVSGSTSPTDQALAIHQAMNQHFRLLRQAIPPSDTDPIEWFLQGKQGDALIWDTIYVMLGRSLGIPMRLAEGYLPGQYDPVQQQFVVRSSNATVWVQMAVPGLGWRNLFPTELDLTTFTPGVQVYATPTSIPTPTVTPTPTPSTKSASASPTPPSNPAAKTPPNNHPPGIGDQLIHLLISPFLLILLGFGSLLALMILFVRRRWQTYGAQLGPLMQFFLRVRFISRLAGIPLSASDTASQATQKVAAHVPDHAESLGKLNQSYERLRYGPPATRMFDAASVREVWNRLRGALWNLVMTRFWRQSSSRKAR